MSDKNEEHAQEELLEQAEEAVEEEREEIDGQQLNQDEKPRSAIPQPLGELKDPSRLSKDEIAYGCTFFSNAHGYSNPLNVITPKALQTRFAPVQQMSLHAAETLLRPPFKPAQSRNFSETKQMKELQLQCIAPCEIQEIMDYRCGVGQTQDAALESFKLLGAKGPDDKIHVNQLAALLIDCYQSLDYQLECCEDYKVHCAYIEEQLDQMERKNPNLKINRGKKESVFQLAPEEDIVSVIKMAIDPEMKTDFIGLEDWRVFFERVSDLVFEDYRKQIERGV